MSKETNIQNGLSPYGILLLDVQKLVQVVKLLRIKRDYKLAKKENSVYFGRKFTDAAFHSDRLESTY